MLKNILTTLTLSFPIFHGFAEGHVCLKTPMPQQNQGCDPAPLNLKNQDYCGFAQDMNVEPSATLVAGQVFTVQFGNPNVQRGVHDPSTTNQARHGGGHVEFALSYDGGSTFRSVAYYLRSAPDVFFDWPFMVPNDAPAGKALFAWVWFPDLSGGPEMYMDCSVVTVSSSAQDVDAFNRKYCPMTEGNLAPRFPTPINAVGDGSKANTVGRGPIEAQVARNTSGQIVTCEDGGVFDVAAANREGDTEGLTWQTTNGSGPREPTGPPAGEDPVRIPEDPSGEPVPEVPEGETPAPELPVPETPSPELPSEPIEEPSVDPAEPVEPVEPVEPAPAPTVPQPTDTPCPSFSAGIYCLTSNPSAFYLCAYNHLVELAVAAGTVCECGEGAPAENGVCGGSIGWA